MECTSIRGQTLDPGAAFRLVSTKGYLEVEASLQIQLDLTLLDNPTQRAVCHVHACHTRPYKAIQGHTRSYKAIQGHTRPYKVIQGYTRPYKAIQGHTRPYKAKQGHTRPYKAIQGHTRQFCTLLLTFLAVSGSRGVLSFYLFIFSLDIFFLHIFIIAEYVAKQTAKSTAKQYSKYIHTAF